MGAFSQLSAYYSEGLVRKAKELNYSDSNLLILIGDEQALKTKYPDVYDNLLSCGHNKEGRTYMEYARDLVASWIFEDDLMAQLRMGGLIIEGAGADKKREILASNKVSASSDCVVSWKEKSILLEIMSDYKGYWTRYGQMDLRDDKYTKLEKSLSLFLGISTKDQKFIFLDFGTDIKATYIPSHRPYGGKPAYQIKFDRSSLLPFNVGQLVELIKSAIESRTV